MVLLLGNTLFVHIQEIQPDSPVLKIQLDSPDQIDLPDKAL